jgi:hypothetical protein
MIRTIEGAIDELGIMRLLGHVKLPSVRCALVTILEDVAVESVEEASLLAESTFKKGLESPKGGGCVVARTAGVEVLIPRVT